MSQKIKLIWDFKGPDGLEIAKHHCIHLKEFTQLENLAFHEVSYHQLNPMHSIAFVIVDDSDMKVYRDALKPHRGALAD